ncbi:rod shape-determining protein MreD [Lutibacter holmesii]|uniref:Rod shape-determining protein MreD n=1 Tax=Lutibacter holmesii TaxID=1137985 RepID=A0ABW3WM16_9FLAO
MNNIILTNSFRFIALLLLQVFVFNHIHLFGYVNPLVYIAWIFLFPIRKNINLFLILSFLLGLSVDFFSDSGGINATAIVFIAFIRLPLLKTILGKSDFDYLLFNLRTIAFSKALLFISILTIIHHFIVFSLSYFSFEDLLTIVSRSLTTSIFSILIILLGITLFTKKK